METARERLQGEYEKDMQDGATKFAEHEKQICKEEYSRGFDEARIQLNTQHEETIQQALADIFERQQEWRDEQYIEAFTLGRTTGIQDECMQNDSKYTKAHIRVERAVSRSGLVP
jgi:hypothetical protein